MYKDNIAKIIKLISLLLESGQIKFQISGGSLLAKVIDIPSLKFSYFNVLYHKAIEIFKLNKETIHLGSLIYAVINRKDHIRNTKNDLSPSYLNLERECLNSLEEVSIFLNYCSALNLNVVDEQCRCYGNNHQVFASAV